MRWDYYKEDVRALVPFGRTTYWQIPEPGRIPVGLIDAKKIIKAKEPLTITVRLYYTTYGRLFDRPGWALAWTDREVYVAYVHGGFMDGGLIDGRVPAPFECWVHASQVTRRDPTVPLKKPR